MEMGSGRRFPQSMTMATIIAPVKRPAVVVVSLLCGMLVLLTQMSGRKVLPPVYGYLASTSTTKSGSSPPSPWSTGRSTGPFIIFDYYIGSGLGSGFIQVEVAARLATMLDGSIGTIRKSTEHGYLFDTQYSSLDYTPPPDLGRGSICRLKLDKMAQVDDDGDLSCEKDKLSLSEKNKHKRSIIDKLNIDGCSIVLLEEGFKPDRTLNPCMLNWLYNTKIGHGVEMRKNILGIHIRWGDLAPGEIGNWDISRTFAPHEVNKAVSHLRHSPSTAGGGGGGGRNKYNVKTIELYMEKPPENYLKDLDFKYEIVSTGSDEGDLRMLSSAEYKILSWSDFGMLAALIGRNGVIMAKSAPSPGYGWEKMDHLEYIELDGIIKE